MEAKGVGGFSDRVRRARRAKAMTQAQLGALIGVAPSAVAQWETAGGTYPSFLNAVELAALLEVSLDWLANGGRHTIEVAHERPAIDLSFLAADELEESLLGDLRRCSDRSRALVASLVSQLASASDGPGRRGPLNSGLARRRGHGAPQHITEHPDGAASESS